MREIRVAIWGFGAMGSGMARMLLTKRGVVVTGVLDIRPELVGRSLHEALGCEGAPAQDVIITDDVDRVITPSVCDIVLVATDSFVKATEGRVTRCLEAGLSVISTAEEMAYPKAQNEEIASRLDVIAKRHGATLFGTGINPGFVLDALILALTATMDDVKAIRASRVNDLAPFGRAVMHEQGVGLSLEAFNERLKASDLAGHVGFAESIGLISEGLGVPIASLEQTKDPIVTTCDRTSPYGEAKRGHVAGIRQQAKAYRDDGSLFIHLDHPQQIVPEAEGVETADTIQIESDRFTVTVKTTPELPGGVGTIAMVVNAIPFVLNASPGLKTMLDMPLPRAVIGDFRDQLNDAGRLRLTGKTRVKGDYVVLEITVLKAAERSANIPSDTAACDLRGRVKGWLLADAVVGEQATIETATGRCVTGRLTAVDTGASHTFGPDQEVLLHTRREVREAMADQARDPART